MEAKEPEFYEDPGDEDSFFDEEPPYTDAPDEFDDEEDLPLTQDSIDSTRMMTDITGALHEFQVTQLKRWPLMALDAVERCEVRITIGDARQEIDDQGRARRCHRPISIEYRAYTDNKEHTENRLSQWKNGSKTLRDWTKALLWPDTEVTILVDSYRIEVSDDVREG